MLGSLSSPRTGHRYDSVCVHLIPSVDDSDLTMVRVCHDWLAAHACWWSRRRCATALPGELLPDWCIARADYTHWMPILVCDLELSQETIVAAYGGVVRYVQTRSREGLQVRFPVRVLRPFVTRDGVRGTFALTIDAHNKLQHLQRLCD